MEFAQSSKMVNVSSSKAQNSFYETDLALCQYLLFHYGDDRDLMPFPFGPKNALHFPIRCVTECVDKGTLPVHAKGLELGCSVGRTSFELGRYCQSVIAVDHSSAFISAARKLQHAGFLEYTLQEEGAHRSIRTARVPEGVEPNRVTFLCSDVMEFAPSSGPFDVVVAANLLCRLHDPQAFLSLLPNLVTRGGQLILISPYSWLEEYTPRSHWLGEDALRSLREILDEDFDLLRFFDIPFLMREHLRKYQFGVAQATIWKRKS
jgi:putative 4-mercaptohistidine N1-methyltranferase